MRPSTPGRAATTALALACTAALTVVTAAGVAQAVRVLDAALFFLSCFLNALP